MNGLLQATENPKVVAGVAELAAATATTIAGGAGPEITRVELSEETLHFAKRLDQLCLERPRSASGEEELQSRDGVHTERPAGGSSSTSGKSATDGTQTPQGDEQDGCKRTVGAEFDVDL